MKVYIAHSLGLSDKVAYYVKFLESLGYMVYFPMRDTQQKGTNAPEVLRANMNGIIWADEVHVVWDGKSYGTLFDLGIAYALRKPIIVIHVNKIKEKMDKLYVRSWYSYLYMNRGETLESFERNV